VTPLLAVEDLHVSYGGHTAVDGVSFTIDRGETLALVGENGCGKTSTALAVLRLIPAQGAIRLDGQDITRLRGRELRAARARMQIVFQDPFSSLNPRMTVSDIIAEPLIAHKRWRGGRPKRVRELLDLVGLRARDAEAYPHEFSGGQRQRIATARALALGPDLLVLDEPVSALDLSVRGQVMNLFSDLRAEFGMAVLFISHDHALVEHFSDRQAVMSRGKIVEPVTSSP